MQIAMIRLHHYLLEKDLDLTMVNPDVVEADKEMVVGDNQLDHGLRTTMMITVTTILIDPEVEQGVKGQNRATIVTTVDRQNGKDLNLVTIIRKRHQ